MNEWEGHRHHGWCLGPYGGPGDFNCDRCVRTMGQTLALDAESIRDRDARAAMAALIAWYEPGQLEAEEEHRESLSRGAYLVADAMQAERERRRAENE